MILIYGNILTCLCIFLISAINPLNLISFFPPLPCHEISMQGSQAESQQNSEREERMSLVGSVVDSRDVVFSDLGEESGRSSESEGSGGERRIRKKKKSKEKRRRANLSSDEDEDFIEKLSQQREEEEEEERVMQDNENINPNLNALSSTDFILSLGNSLKKGRIQSESVHSSRSASPTPFGMGLHKNRSKVASAALSMTSSQGSQNQMQNRHMQNYSDTAPKRGRGVGRGVSAGRGRGSRGRGQRGRPPLYPLNGRPSNQREGSPVSNASQYEQQEQQMDGSYGFASGAFADANHEGGEFMRGEDTGSNRGGGKKSLADKVAEAFTGIGFTYEVGHYIFGDDSYTLDLKEGEFAVDLNNALANRDEMVMTYVNSIVSNPSDVVPNLNGDFNLLPERISKSNKMTENWTVVSHETVDKYFPQLRDTSPIIQVTKISHSMAIPDDIRKLLFVVEAVNNSPNLNSFALPTTRTRLETEGTRVVKRVLHETRDRFTGKAIFDHARKMMLIPEGDEGGDTDSHASSHQGERITLSSPRECTFEKPTYEMSFVKNEAVQFFVALYPVQYICNGEKCRAVAWSATAVPLPGVNFLHAVRSLNEAFASSTRMRPEVYTQHTESVRATWLEIVRSACYDGRLDVPMDISAGMTDAYNLNDAHEARIMSPFTFHRKVLNQLDMYEAGKTITEVEVIGHVCVESKEHMDLMDKMWEDCYTVNQAWYRTFRNAMVKSYDFGGFNRALIPPIVFPPTPKYSIVGSLGAPENSEHLPHYYQSLFCQAPVIICHRPREVDNAPKEYMSMHPLMLPAVVDGVVAEWFFGIDQSLFLTEIDSWDGKGMPPNKNKNSVLDNLPFLMPNTYCGNRVAMQTYVHKVLHSLSKPNDQASTAVLEASEDFNKTEFPTRDTVSPFALLDHREHQQKAEQAVLRMKNFLKAAFAKITSDASDKRFQSEHIEGVFEVVHKFVKTVVSDMQVFRNEMFDTDVGSDTNGVVMGVSYALDGALSHQGGCLKLNRYMDQNAANLTIYRELFTCNGAMMGPHAQTWQSYLWTLWICVLNGLITMTPSVGHGQNSNVDYKCCDKPNAAGIDTAVILNKHKTVKLLHDSPNDVATFGLTDYSMTSASPHAIETMTTVSVIGRQVTPQFTRENHLQLIHMTEFRPPDMQSALDMLVKCLPRDQAMQAKMVHTTDVNANGQRSQKTFYHVQRFQLVVIATNKQVATRDANEDFDSMRACVVFFPAGRDRCEPEIEGDKREIENASVGFGNRTMQFPSSIETRRLFRSGMALAEVISKAIFVTHWTGFTSIEVPAEAIALYEWYRFVFNQCFRWTLPAKDATSTFERVLVGWKARGVSDMVLHSVIGRFAGVGAAHKDGSGGTESEMFIAALTETMLTLQHGAHAMYMVPVQFHLALKHMIDPRPIIVNHVFVQELRPPIVAFDWLWRVIREGVTVHNRNALLEDPDYLAVRGWIGRLISSRLFLPQTTVMGMDYTNNVTPYICSAGNGIGAGAKETLLRTRVEGNTDPHLVFGREVAASKLAEQVFRGTGVPAKEEVWRSAFRAYRQLVPNMNACFGAFSIFNVRDVMKLFQVENIPPKFNRVVADGAREWGAEMVKQIQFGTEERYIATGVHFMGLLLLSSLYHRDVESGFHSNMTSNVASNLMSFAAVLSPPTVMLGGHKAMHVKTFRFGNSGVPRGSVIKKVKNQEVDYYLRGDGDTDLFTSNCLLLLDGTFNSYMFEDTVHMAQIISFMRTHGMQGRHLFAVPVHELNPEYELVPHRHYPIVKVDEEKMIAGSICVTASGVSVISGYVNKQDFSIALPDPEDETVDCEQGPISQIHGEYLPHSLGSQHIIVMPLIRRRNAIVFSQEDGFGVIQQIGVDEDGVPTYFDCSRLSYKILWADKHVTMVNFILVDQMLQRVASFVCVHYTCPALDDIKGSLFEQANKSYIRGNLYYPNGIHMSKQSEEHKTCAYVMFDRFIMHSLTEKKFKRVPLIKPVQLHDLVHFNSVKDSKDMHEMLHCRAQRATNASNPLAGGR